MIADLTQALQKASHRWDAVHVARHRLHNDAGYQIANLIKGLLYLFQVVVVQGDGVLGQRGGYTRRAGLAQGQGAGAGFYQEGVGMAVVTALKLYDLIPSGIAASQADGAHGGLGAGADHAHHIQGRH